MLHMCPHSWTLATWHQKQKVCSPNRFDSDLFLANAEQLPTAGVFSVCILKIKFNMKSTNIALFDHHLGFKTVTRCRFAVCRSCGFIQEMHKSCCYILSMFLGSCWWRDVESERQSHLLVFWSLLMVLLFQAGLIKSGCQAEVLLDAATFWESCSLLWARAVRGLPRWA